MLLRSSGRRTWAACSTPHSAVTWTSGNTVPTPGIGVMPELENEPPAFGNTSTGRSTNRFRSSATFAFCSASRFSSAFLRDVESYLSAARSAASRESRPARRDAAGNS